MAISFNGYKNEAITFEADGVTASYPVKMKSNGTVTDCADGNDFIGIALSVRDDISAVQTDGFVTLPYTGTAPTVGFTALGANGSGGVKALSTAAKKYKVLTVDSVNSTVGFML